MSAKTWGVVGAAGMLGRDVVRELERRGESVRAWGRADLDIVDGDIGPAIRGCDVVVNCAAYTAVDDAEADEPAARAVNATAAGRLARACRDEGVRLVHVSTDYVFDGRARAPYPESAPTAPTSAYGRTKAEGEALVRQTGADALIVRTAWLYGAHGRSFPRTIVGLARDRGAVSVVDDQHGQPTWTADVARVIVDLVSADAPAGIYHATSSGQATWCDFARAALDSAGLDAVLTPVGSDAFPRPATRPAWSVLAHDALVYAGVAPIGPWRERWQTASAEILV
ncbi:dTDP-4-dehydrorhamnose reductase [Demequina muriae]|uniref:dTDP-4-dehydrorhamnose reductase n=1 Tax=Demequina muriae TaxID=3051664 RepID=A0ABT8GFG2_9MICO|nr:dTDP-4-dehydrorhamnose reductase [Demequina sp. EGI L300058]MDN4480173.1 dTDP-4-dehydrorhamnose reductase [Demequina sp. EGI L300058]